MPFPFLQVLLAAFLLSLYRLGGDWEFAAYSPLLSPGFSLAVSTIPFLVGRLALSRIRNRLATGEPDVRRFVGGVLRAGRVLRLSVLASFATALYVGNWPRTVSSLGIDSWPLIPEALSFAPFVIALIGALVPSYELSTLLRPAAWTRSDFVSFQLRMAALPLIPLAFFILILDIREGNATLKRWLDLFAYLNIVGMVLLVAALFAFAPVVLRLVLGARRLPDGPLRSSLETLARQVSFRHRELLVMRTSGNILNAMIIGLLPRLRYVIFSDGLLVNLTSEEIRAVFAHEMGHAKRHHLYIYLAFSLTYVFLFLALQRLVFPLAPSLLGEEKPLGWLLVFLFFAIYWGLGFGYLSRRIERVADVFGVRAVGGASVFIEALERIAHLAGNVRRQTSWRHGSVERRVAFLPAADRDPEVLRRARRGLRACVATLFVLFVTSLFFVAEDVRAQHQAGLAILAIEEKDYARAETHLREAIERSPRDTYYHFHLAEILAITNRHEEARREWRAALSLKPPPDLEEAIKKRLHEVAKLLPEDGE